MASRLRSTPPRRANNLWAGSGNFLTRRNRYADNQDRHELLDRLRAQRKFPPPAERRRIREHANASLRDVGRALGVSHSLVRHWEAGGMPRERLLTSYGALLDELRLIGLSREGGRL
jgi:hypothetical protein